MSHKITITPSGHDFMVEDEQVILDAALQHGISFPYGCRGGGCGVCKGKVVAGDVSYINGMPPGISQADADEGYVLCCQAKASSDVTLEVKEISSIKEIVIKNLPTRVHKMERLSEDVMRVFLLIPPTERLQFLSGQYIEIVIKDGRRRAFSIANAPFDDKYLELHIKYVPGGDFTEYVFNEMKERDLLRFEGPHGTFTLNEASDKPIIMLATGTGFAPIKSILEHAFSEGVTRPIHFYWGGRTEKDFYMASLVNEWIAKHDNFKFYPVLSHPEAGWQGHTGHVQEAVLKDFADLTGYEVYACGNPSMVKEGYEALTKHGIAEGDYLSDAFTFAPK